MPVTLTIKHVPERLAEGLRRRAAANRRSQQQELLLMLEREAADVTRHGVTEPAHPVYRTGAVDPATPRRKAGARKPDPPPHGPHKLSLDALWQRARDLGGGMPSESSAIVRADRDAGRR
ncbi:MAG: FitA-like ribbon-helix-helix domain-containing protein [Rhodanobacteraceae bacterium]